MSRKYLTKKGLRKLQEELEKCKKKKREISEAIKFAKEQGDLSENAEYTEAKAQQRENDSRIIELENIIRTAEVVSDDVSTDRVGIGCTVVVQANKTKNRFSIVGASEADPANGCVSNESPLGQGLIGRKKGEIAHITLPNGKNIEYKILSIEKSEE